MLPQNNELLQSVRIGHRDQWVMGMREVDCCCSLLTPTDFLSVTKSHPISFCYSLFSHDVAADWSVHRSGPDVNISTNKRCEALHRASWSAEDTDHGWIELLKSQLHSFPRHQKLPQLRAEMMSSLVDWFIIIETKQSEQKWQKFPGTSFSNIRNRDIN